MKDNSELLLARYRDSDLDERLTMYLTYRNLRDDFEMIESCETDKVTVNSTPKNSGFNFVGYFSKQIIKCLKFSN